MSPISALVGVLVATTAWYYADLVDYYASQPQAPSPKVAASKVHEQTQVRKDVPQPSSLGEIIHQCTKALTPESYRENSPYCFTPSPSFQASVWTDVTGEWILLGHALRLGDYLLINHHTLQQCPQDVLTLMIIRPGRETVSVPLSKFQFDELYEDIWYAPIGSLVLSGLKTMKVAHVESKHIVQIATDLRTDNASSGVVENDPNSWGLVTYHGSTRHGFSGAAYHIGQRAFAMHAMGGKDANRGYSLSYLAQKLHRNESSDYAALQGALSVATDKTMKSRRVNPDEIEVYHLGRYYIIDAREAKDLVDYESRRLQASTAPQYEAATVSENCQSPPCGGNWLRALATGFLPQECPEAPSPQPSETPTSSDGLLEDQSPLEEALLSILDLLTEQRKTLDSLEKLNVSASKRLTQLEMRSSTLSQPTAQSSTTSVVSSGKQRDLTNQLLQALASLKTRRRSAKPSAGTASAAQTKQRSNSCEQPREKGSRSSPSPTRRGNAGAQATVAAAPRT